MDKIIKFEVDKPIKFKLHYDFPEGSELSWFGKYQIRISGETIPDKELATMYSSCKVDQMNCHNCALFKNDCHSLAREIEDKKGEKGDVLEIVKRYNGNGNFYGFEVKNLSKLLKI